MVALANLEEEDRRGLNRALCMATLPRRPLRQLPTQVWMLGQGCAVVRLAQLVVVPVTKESFFELWQYVAFIVRTTYGRPKKHYYQYICLYTWRMCGRCNATTIWRKYLNRYVSACVSSRLWSETSLSSQCCAFYCYCLDKAYIRECARFVESLHRRRVQVVDARKKRSAWGAKHCCSKLVHLSSMFPCKTLAVAWLFPCCVHSLRGVMLG